MKTSIYIYLLFYPFFQYCHSANLNVTLAVSGIPNELSTQTVLGASYPHYEPSYDAHTTVSKNAALARYILRDSQWFYYVPSVDITHRWFTLSFEPLYNAALQTQNQAALYRAMKAQRHTSMSARLFMKDFCQPRVYLLVIILYH